MRRRLPCPARWTQSGFHQASGGPRGVAHTFFSRKINVFRIRSQNLKSRRTECCSSIFSAIFFVLMSPTNRVSAALRAAAPRLDIPAISLLSAPSPSKNGHGSIRSVICSNAYRSALKHQIVPVDQFIPATVAEELLYFTRFVANNLSRICRTIGGKPTSNLPSHRIKDFHWVRVRNCH